MTRSNDDGNSPQAEPSSTPGSDLVVARLNDAGEVEVRTPVAGDALRFVKGAKFLTEEQFTILGPLGIKREWDPAAVLNFLMDAGRRGFDPYSKEIHLMRYKGRDGFQYVHHIGIHGMRRHADETGLYGGIKPVRYAGDDGKWVEVWPYRDKAPYACKVIMVRRDWDEPIEQVGYYDEFAPLVDEWIDNVKTGRQIPAPMWRPGPGGGMATVMLAKCTKAMTFREGWPNRFGNWYAAEEFHRAKVEGDQGAHVDERADRRQQAYAAATGAQTIDGEAVETVVDPDQDTMPAHRVRAMLLAELAAQAEIIGRDVAFMVSRWQETRSRSFDTASIGEVASHVRECRPYIVTALRAAGRHEVADRYAEAPMPGTLLELFGADPRGAAQGTEATQDDEQKVAAA